MTDDGGSPMTNDRMTNDGGSAMTNDGMTNDEWQRANSASLHSAFGIESSFVIRHSSFQPPAACSILAVALLAAMATAWAAEAPPTPKEPAPTAHVLVLGGLSGDPHGAYARAMRDWMSRFTALMLAEKVPAGQITVLGETPDPQAKPPVGESTLASVRAAFEKIARVIRPQDQFLLFVVGHGTVTEPVGKLCLPGSDLNANDLAKMLDGLLTRNVILINCASGGAEILSKCARPGRVIISAAGVQGEGIQTYFAEFFLLGYETRKADRNGDGKITLLEAFNWAAAECVDWYHRQSGLKPTEEEKRAKVRILNVYGKETCRLFQKFYEGTRMKLNPEDSRPNDPDADPSELARDGAMKGRARETTELASLEDQGEPTKAAVHWVRNEHVFLDGQPGQQGEVAARAILGRPAQSGK